MEKVFPRVSDTTDSQLFLRQFGKGRVAYIPFDLDRTFWEVLAVDHSKLMRNIVHWATNEAPLVIVDGPGILDVTVWQQKDSMTVHLVNLTNPMMMKGPFRELIPAPRQEVTIDFSAFKRPKNVKLLAFDKKTKVNIRGNTLRVTVPEILDHEIIAIS